VQKYIDRVTDFQVRVVKVAFFLACFIDTRFEIRYEGMKQLGFDKLIAEDFETITE
jgi:hypothetical protein